MYAQILIIALFSQLWHSRIIHSRTPEIETADVSQSHAGLILSQFQTYCVLRINSGTEILNYFKIFESIFGIVTTLTNRKYGYFKLLKPFINWYIMHYFSSMMNVYHMAI